MKQLTKIYRIRLAEKQVETLNKLPNFGINVSHFIRLAIKEKLERDYRLFRYEPKTPF